MAYTVSLASLGCSKNQIDAEIMLAKLALAGFEYTAEEDEADIVIVNTRAFIEDAKTESIDVILDIARLKQEGKLKLLVVTGCMAERYREQILNEMPEVDVVVGIGSNADIVKIITKALEDGKRVCKYDDKQLLPLSGPRFIATPHYMAYIKIAEGCDNRCTYCAIPGIRGRYRSRTMDDIVGEAEMLARRGVKELILIAQDTTRWGEDIGNERLTDLLERLCKIEGIKWLRILYAYPERVDDRLISVIRDNPKIVKYIDIPLQHSEDKILRRMNRRITKDGIISLVHKLRQEIPEIVLRTTILTGFPGETEEDFENLLSFVKEMRFEKLGCFAYSQEEGTPAAEFDNQIDEDTKKCRQERVMQLQQEISDEINEALIGQTREVLAEGYDVYIRMWYGRSAAEAPEVDGKIFFTSDKEIEPGEFIKVKLIDIADGELVGEAL